MKLSMKLSLCIIILAVMGCGKESDQQIIPGWISPGVFRPKGVASEKTYNFSSVSKSCAAGTGNCNAVYCGWVTGTSYSQSIPTVGVAVDDKHTTPHEFNFRMLAIPGTFWSITMVVNGKKYVGSSSDIRLTKLESADDTLPFFDVDNNGSTPIAPDEDDLLASNIKIKIMVVEFTAPITLTAEDASTVTINTTSIGGGGLPNGGDYIVGHINGI
jgi:hypothetical protein